MFAIAPTTTGRNFNALDVQPVETIVDASNGRSFLKGLTGMRNGQQVFASGYYTAGDGGGGSFYWDSASSATDNGGTIIAPDAGGVGRWRAIHDGTINAARFGMLTSRSATENATALQAAVKVGVRKVIVPPGAYSFTTRLGTYNDGTYTKNDTYVGAAIPSNVTIFGYGVTLTSIQTNQAQYAFFAAYTSSNVHIKGFTLIGDRDGNTYNPAVPDDYGFGIDFRDVTDCSVEDVISNKMWGDSFYLGVIDTGGTGSNRVYYKNIQGTNSRRQGLSITGGQDIIVDGYRFYTITGAVNGPGAGIDIEPNTSDLVNNVILRNGIVKDSLRSVEVYKTINLVLDGLESENNEYLFPNLVDRVYEATISNVVGRGGAATQRALSMNGAKDITRVTVNNFILKDAAAYPMVISDTVANPFVDVVFNNGQIFVQDTQVTTSTASAQTLGMLVFNNVTFVIPTGYDNADASSLTASTILDSTNALWRNCTVNHRGTATGLIFDPGVYGNQGIVTRGTAFTVTKDALSLQNSWVTATGYETPFFLKNANNEVTVHGAIKDGTTTDTTLLFTLPAGFRPSADVFCPVVHRDGAAAIAQGAVIVGTNGQVTILGTGFANNRAALNGIRFQAAN